MLTLYIGQQTWLHAQPAGRKLLVLAMVSIGLLPITSLTAASVSLIAVVALYASIGRVGWNRLAQSLRTLAWLVAILAGAQIFIASIQGALDGLLLSTVGVAMAKLATLVLLAELVTITTPLQALLSAIEPLLRPLNVLGLSSERLSLSIGLLIRLATFQRSNWAQLSQAYQARGITRPGLKLLAPSLRAGLRQADQMAQALNARLAAEGPVHSQSPRPRE